MRARAIAKALVGWSMCASAWGACSSGSDPHAGCGDGLVPEKECFGDDDCAPGEWCESSESTPNRCTSIGYCQSTSDCPPCEVCALRVDASVQVTRASCVAKAPCGKDGGGGSGGSGRGVSDAGED